MTTPAARVHHSAICPADLEASLRFYRDGLGMAVLMDQQFEGDWPALFGAPTRRLRSVFLGSPAGADAGVVELVVFEGAEARGDAPAPVPGPGPGAGSGAVGAAGFFLLSLFVDLEDTLGRLAALGYRAASRIEQPAPGGAVAMATVRDPDGVLVELIDTGGPRGQSG